MANQPAMYICKNIDGECEFALSKQPFQIRQGEELICPNCKKRDIQAVGNGGTGQGSESRNTKWKKFLVPLIAIAAIVVVFLLIRSCGGEPSCKGWECDGIYVALNDTSVKLFDKNIEIGKNDTIRVANGNVIKKDFTPTDTGSRATPSSDTANHFTSYFYTPPSPIIDINNSKLKGIIEMGATGFDYSIIRINPSKEWELVKYKPGWSLVYEDDATPEYIITQLKSYIGEIYNIGVQKQNIHFVISSGASREPKVGPIISAIRSLGYIVNSVTPDQEATLALKCALPKMYAGKGFVVDIGSSNTKIAWLRNGRVSTLATHGAKYRKKGEFSDTQVYSDIKNLVANIPDSSKDACFIIGGVPYQLSQMSKAENGRYIRLKSPNYYNPGGDDKLIGGINIYRAIADETGCKKFAFDTSSHFGIGLLLSLIY